MTKQEIITRVKALNLPKDSYVVFGSCPLAAADIREAGDIDLLVTPEVLAELKRAGWQRIDKGPNDRPYTHGVFDAHANWDFSPYSPTLSHLLKTTTTFDGVPFASLDEVRKWKAATGGPKHLADVALIDKYLWDKQIGEVLAAWKPHLDAITDWQSLVKGINPKSTGCGPVYELDNPVIERPDESFAIADMRNILVAEPHYHPGGETEIYIVLSGSGKIVVGGEAQDIQKGAVVVTPPDTTHFTIPKKDLVIAVINTPSFNPANYIPITESNPAVAFDKDQFDRLTKQARHAKEQL